MPVSGWYSAGSCMQPYNSYHNYSGPNDRDVKFDSHVSRLQCRSLQSRHLCPSIRIATHQKKPRDRHHLHRKNPWNLRCCLNWSICDEHIECKYHLNFKGSWGICVAFASFLILILLPIIHIFVKETPLYLLATDNNPDLNQFIDHVNDLEYNQIWHNIPARRIQDATRVSYKQFTSDKFDPDKIGKFWMNIPEIF